MCVPVSGPVPSSGRIVARAFSPATVASTLHVGPQDELGAAHAALSAWIADHGFEVAGRVIERCLNSPGDDTSAAD